MENIENQFFEYNLRFCCQCKRDIYEYSKIIAEMKEPKGQYLAFCMVCFAGEDNTHIEAYYVQKANKNVAALENQDKKSITSAYQTIEAEGIEQLLNPKDEEGQKKVNTFNRLN